MAPGEFGHVSIFMSVCAILLTFYGMGFPNLMVRVAAKERDESGLRRSNSFLKFALSYSMAASIASISLCLIFMAVAILLLPNWIGGTAVIVFALMFVTLQVRMQILSAFLRGRGKLVAGQIFECIVYPLGLLTLLWAHYQSGLEASLYTAMTAFIVSSLCALGITTLFVLKESQNKTFAKYSLRNLTSHSGLRRYARLLPVHFMLADGIMVFNQNADVLIVGFLSDTYAAGAYRVASQTSLAALLVLGSINVVIYPYLCRLVAQKDYLGLRRAYVLTALGSTLASMVALAIVAAFGPDFLVAVFGVRYIASIAPLQILLLGYTINQAIGPIGIVLNAQSHEKIVFNGLLISAALNVVLNLFLVPVLGMNGAAVSTSITLILSKLIMIQQYRANLRPSLNRSSKYKGTRE